MKVLFVILFTALSSLYAKPIIDLRDSNMAPQHDPAYERPDFIWMTQGKNSHVVVLSDNFLHSAREMRRKFGYRKVVAYLMEPRVIHPGAYSYIAKHMDYFDLVLTFDEELLSRFPQKCRFVHAIGCGSLNEPGIHEKSKLCSIMTGKDWTEGHKLRLDAYARYREYFDGYKGYDTPFARWKDPWINDFCFSVIIENSRAPHYFTEKLTECLRAGTVPIYWGSPTIGNFFDLEGMILFDNLEQLGEILKNLSVEEYQKRLPAIQRNFELAAQYPESQFLFRPEVPDSMDVCWKYLRAYFE